MLIRKRELRRRGFNFKPGRLESISTFNNNDLLKSITILIISIIISIIDLVLIIMVIIQIIILLLAGSMILLPITTHLS